MKPFARFAGLAISAALTAAPFAASAQDAYPSREITIVGTSAAGSPLDTMLRQLAQGLSEELGVSVVVENRPGGSGAVGMATAMSQPADGYTLVSATGSTTFTIAKGEIPFTFDDFDVLRGVQSEPSSIAVRADSPYQSLDDLVTALKETPDEVQVGGFGAAGFHQFAFYQLASAAGFEPTWIPFDGGNEAALALLGGHVDAVAMTPSSAGPQIENGELRLLGIATEERSSFFPDVPTFKEQGFDVVEAIWRGIMVREDTPQEAVDRLLSAIEAVEQTQAWQDYMQTQGQLPMTLTMEEMQDHVANEVSTRRTFLEENGFIN